MIDTALKHFVYEKCIDILFEGIRKNFVSTKGDLLSQLKKGRYRKIVTKNYPMVDADVYIQYEYEDVEIVDFLEDYIIINFSSIKKISNSVDVFITEHKDSIHLKNGVYIVHTICSVPHREWIKNSHLISVSKY